MRLLLLCLVPGCAWVTGREVDELVDADGDGVLSHDYGGPDCDDDDPEVLPGNQLAEAPVRVYVDVDGDGYGSDEQTVEACVPPPGFVANAEDCDDGDATLGHAHPQFQDRDGDGFGAGDEGESSSCVGVDPGWVENGDDCDDDDDAVTAWVPAIQFLDDDGDGLGGSVALASPSCSLVEGYAANSDDCDDGDDDVAGPTAWFADGDGDGFGTGPAVALACGAPAGLAGRGDDCDDDDASVGSRARQYPDADQDGYGSADLETETLATDCGADEDHALEPLDCDDTDGTRNPETVWSLDVDGDGIGGDQYTLSSCLDPTAELSVSAYVLRGGDCDDADSTISDFAWPDQDGDGFGDGVGVVGHCDAPTHSVFDGDCDDSLADEYPGVVWYFDDDGDGDGGPEQASLCSRPSSGADASDASDDCDDTDAAVHPGADDLARDGVDQDCDGTDLDDDDDGFPDLPGCATLDHVEVHTPQELGDAVQQLSACDLVILSALPDGQGYGPISVPGTLNGAAMFWAPDEGVRLAGVSDPTVLVPAGSVLLEGMELVENEVAAVSMLSSRSLTLSDVRVVGGVGIVVSSEQAEGVGADLTLLGTTFEGVDLAVGGDRALGEGAAQVSAATLGRVTVRGALSADGLVRLSSIGAVNVAHLTVDHSAALGALVEVRSSTAVVGYDWRLEDSLAGRAISVQAPVLDLRMVDVAANGLLGDQLRAMVELRGRVITVDGLRVVDNVTDGAAILTWLALCDDGDAACGDRLDRAPINTAALRHVAIARNTSDFSTRALRSNARATIEELVVHQQRGTWIHAEAGFVDATWSTLAGRAPDGIVGADLGARIVADVDGTIDLDDSVVDIEAGDGVSDGAVTFDDVVLGDGHLLRSFVGVDDEEVDYRLATSCPAAPPGPPPVILCEDADLLHGAFRPGQVAQWSAAPQAAWMGRATSVSWREPAYEDSDGDGLLDDWELTFFGPLGAGPNVDSDADQLTNLWEQNVGTYPDTGDSDADLHGDREDVQPFLAEGS